MNEKLTTIKLIIVGVCLVVFFSLFFLYREEIKMIFTYADAKQELREKDYKEAFELFKKLGDYKDSEQLKIESARKIITTHLEKEEFKQVIVFADELSTKEQEELKAEIDMAKLQLGITHYKLGNHSKAKILFSQVPNTQDVKGYLDNIETFDKFRGTWIRRDKYGNLEKAIFTKNKVYLVTLYDKLVGNSIFSYDANIKDGMIETGAGLFEVIDDKLYLTFRFIDTESDDKQGVYERRSDSTEVPNKQDPIYPKIGMTADEARNTLWGKPLDVNRTTTKYRVYEQWVFGGGRYLYLEDNIVTGIQE